MIFFNRKNLEEKIYACWIGKNIGGTMGAPYEGQQQLNDIQGFSTPEGEVLPNDDLDLQLVWLRALNEQGPNGINSKVLGEYWTNFIGPNWNEYGVCKANMRSGILPPLSGVLNNGQWCNSNGAWIRTEIWACTNPGCPENAIRFAFEDASVDHGFGEGSYAAIFIAAIESAAFIFNDINVLIKIGLSKIPEDCRVAKSVKLVMRAYEEGIDWKDVRNMIVEDSADLGWFQAPANIAFVILGLLYGEGDFKKSMILAINCGDDTDCTGATLGSIMGIMYGMEIIPKDWMAHIGDSIVTISIIRGFGSFPTTCKELTKETMSLIPICTRKKICPGGDVYAEHVVITDGPDNFGNLKAEDYYGEDFVKETFKRSQFSFTMEGVFADAMVEFDAEPVISINGELECRISVLPKHNFSRQDNYSLYWYLPEGWTVEGKKHLFAPPFWYEFSDCQSVKVKICAGERIAPINRIVLELRNADHAYPILMPITILG